MELKNIEIKNFKSIENMKLNLEKDCKILVGLSESGKTNFLTALRTLDSTFHTDKTYVKEGTRKDYDSYIDFELTFDKEEKSIILEELSKYDYLSKLVLKRDEEINLFEFLDDKIIYRVDVRTNERKYIYYTYEKNDKFKLNPNYTYIDASPTKKQIIKSIKDNSEKQIDSFIIISNKEYQVNLDNNIDSLHDILEEKIIKIIEDRKLKIPKVLYWEYSDKYLLPEIVNINEFNNNNDICIPLKNMFELCNITNIKEEYEDKKAMGESSFQNLLDDVSNTVDGYLKKVWKSMPNDSKIVLQEVGEVLKIRIKDSKNTFSASKRSDGFKRIVTFLLMLSIDNKNNILNNTLILIDEPDSKIDIPGQEYLRDELINIGKNNYVIFSTHSTDMIDNRRLERHIIIKKVKEASTIEFANDDNYVDIATLYRALGMNVYSVINEHNLVFEGWTDQLIFELYVGKSNRFFKNIGRTHLSGITKINQYAEFWGLLSKKYYIISDCDDAALNMKCSFEENRFDGTWLTYKELTNDKIITLEDFVTNDRIIKVAKEFKKKNNFSIDLCDDNLKTDIGKANAIKQWISLNSGKYNLNKQMKDFKNKLYNNIKKTDITDDYDDFIKNITKKIEEGA